MRGLGGALVAASVLLIAVGGNLVEDPRVEKRDLYLPPLPPGAPVNKHGKKKRGRQPAPSHDFEDGFARAQNGGMGTRIIGGGYVDESEHDVRFMVSLQTWWGAHFCGGSLIDKEWVLSAAHCFKHGPPDRVRVGQHQVYAHAQETPYSVYRYVTEYYVHEQYDDYTLANDIAIFKLDQPVPGAPTVDIEGSFDVRGKARVLGWGTVYEGGPESKWLKSADVPLVSYNDCTHRKAYPKKWVNKEKQVCAGYKWGKHDACQGDSGGPLVSKSSANKYVQVGIVSWGEGCGKRFKYGVYTRVDAYTDWIRQSMGFSRPPTQEPTRHPTPAPTNRPTRFPTPFPTSFPTKKPTEAKDDEDEDDEDEGEGASFDDWKKDQAWCGKRRNKKVCERSAHKCSWYKLPESKRMSCNTKTAMPPTPSPTPKPFDELLEEWENKNAVCNKSGRNSKKCQKAKRKGCSWNNGSCIYRESKPSPP